MEIHPKDLLEGSEKPLPLGLQPQRASALASSHGLVLKGDDLEIHELGPLSRLSRRGRGVMLTYIMSARFADELSGVEDAVVICTSELAEHVPKGNTRLLTEQNPEEVFYGIHTWNVEQGHYDTLKSYVSESARVESSVVVAPNVFIDDGAFIRHGTVVRANTYVGKGVTIRSNATIGEDGYEIKIIRGKRSIVSHAGGVWLSEGAEVGPNSCVNKALFGDFAYLGPYTKLANMVSVGHATTIGKASSVAARTGIAGMVEDGVWLAPNVSIDPRVTVGSHCLVGTGSVVTRDLPPHALAYGSPAKVHAWVCECRTKLTFKHGKATCSTCNARYVQDAGGRIRRM
jgi:UDP-3-O-[3-hydroxymyristoyl] glucosamine N-acyltransferase